MSRTIRSALAGAVATVCIAVPGAIALPGALAATAQAAPSVAADPSVITEWNTIAARTIFTENATPIPSASLYFGFTSLAVYDAVTAIEGGYQPYIKQAETRANASSEVAAATSAYRVLRHYFPDSKKQLARSYEASLAKVPAGPGVLQGQRVGEAAADAIIGARQDDGRNAPITLDVDPGPGVWRPTPPALAPMAVPWLGFVDPLLLDSPTQVDLPGPDPITSTAYSADFAEVKDYGAKAGSKRSAEQTETALFYNANVIVQYQQGLAGQVTRRGLDIEDRARAFALLNAGVADSLIACWRAKYDYAYWRPITAIREADTDGNDATAPDPGWDPLATTPPYSDYVSGHACVSGAASEVLGSLFGPTSLDLDLTSSGVPGLVKHYENAAALDADTMNARIWLGLHFRRAMTDGNGLGHAVAELAGAQHLRPAG
ncbi:MAG TPA: vanadium-dependent haloperoxidase [Acidimicrobiales bacterium]|nr:vanadium-dependent haloperoxidase [Acidimicrobiales bacterium]